MEFAAARAPGKTMLKVTGILFIVFGAISLILGLLALAGAAMMYELGTTVPGGFGIEYAAGAVALAAAVMIGQSLFSIFLGIMALVNAAKPHKCGVVRALAIVQLALVLLMLVVDPSIIAIVGFVLPILTLIGAQQNIKAHKEAMEYPMPHDQNPYNPHN